MLGGKAVIDGTLEVGIYSVLVYMTQRLLWPLTDLGNTLDLYQRAMASTRRIFGLLDTAPTMQPGTEELPRPVRGDLCMGGVSFGYGDAPDVVRGIDIAIPAGETHAIVGPTGAGKSTVLRLLLRFHDPRQGAVTLDGHDLRNLSYRSLRSAIGYVSQDVFLFQGTVRENLAFGRPDADDAAIVARRRARRGPRVHRGPAPGLRHDRRRAGPEALGRAAPAPLDRPRHPPGAGRAPARRSHVRGRQRDRGRHPALAGPRRPRAHGGRDRPPLSTVRDADRIWVLEAGGVAEVGTHDELVEAGGLYAALWRVQTGEAAHR